MKREYIIKVFYKNQLLYTKIRTAKLEFGISVNQNNALPISSALKEEPLNFLLAEADTKKF